MAGSFLGAIDGILSPLFLAIGAIAPFEAAYRGGIGREANRRLQFQVLK